MSMEYHGQRPRSSYDVAPQYNCVRKSQLPDFGSFMRTTSQTDLTYRGPLKLESAFTSPASYQSSLLTPPSTSGQQPNWFTNDGQREAHYEHQSAVIDDHELPPIAPCGWSSVVLPLKSRPQPRPARAFSSTNVDMSSGSVPTWSHGPVIQEEDVPGKGVCYVYDDGSVCPKEVNGDVVNPKWGTTKAGKPRKRLGQACNTCREKKIRCEPQAGYIKCSQCSRFSRDCEFADASRQAQESPKRRSSAESPGTASTQSPREYVPSRKASLAANESSTTAHAVHRTFSRLSGTVEDLISPIMSEQHTSDTVTPSRKRQKREAEFPDSTHPDDRFEAVSVQRPTQDVDHLGFAPYVDPTISNVKLAKEYLGSFMEFINVPTFEIFPPMRFMQWAMNNRSKSLQDRLTLYAMMAFGTVHSSERDRATHRQIFKDIIYQEIDRIESQYTLQTVHMLLFLAFAEFADAQYQKGFSIFARCVGAIAFLQLSVEQAREDACQAYDFPPSVYIECRRRTYWAAFCTDAYAGLSKGDPRLLHNDNVFLRLPCTRELYEQDQIPVLPVFDQENVVPKSISYQERVAMGDMAWLLQIATICSDIQLNTWRCQNFLRIDRQQVQDRLVRDKLEARLRGWVEGYREAIRAKDATSHPESDHNNADSSAKMQTAFGLDILFHHAHMEMSRRVYHRALSEKEIQSHAKNATVHAIEVLKLAQQLYENENENIPDYIFVTRSPLTGYAIHTAIDIITAAGRIEDILQPQSPIMSCMWTASGLLENLGQYWASARMQHLEVKDRIKLVYSSAQAATYERKEFFYCSDPMTLVVDMDFDVIYGTNRKQYLRAGYSNSSDIRDTDIFDIDTRKRETLLRASA